MKGIDVGVYIFLGIFFVKLFLGRLRFAFFEFFEFWSGVKDGILYLVM